MVPGWGAPEGCSKDAPMLYFCMVSAPLIPLCCGSRLCFRRRTGEIAVRGGSRRAQVADGAPRPRPNTTSATAHGSGRGRAREMAEFAGSVEKTRSFTRRSATSAVRPVPRPRVPIPV